MQSGVLAPSDWKWLPYLSKPENGKASNVLNVAKDFIVHPTIGKSV